MKIIYGYMITFHAIKSQKCGIHLYTVLFNSDQM